MKNQLSKNISVFSLAGLWAVLLLAAASAHAGTLWWDGAASTVNSASDNATTTAQSWLSGGNWDNGVTSAVLSGWKAGDDAIFGGSAASQTITAGPLTIGNLTFGGGGQGATAGSAPIYTISGGTITLSAGSILAVNTPTTISSILTGASGSFTKTGIGTGKVM